MFILNFKVNGNKLGKIFLVILFILIVIITLIVGYRILGDNFFKTNDTMTEKNIYELTAANYTNVLKSVHDNLDDYVGQRISFIGYIYRMIDFNEKQFVLARDMVISSDFQTVVVGFLCEYKNATDFEDSCWVAIEGEITRGDYRGEMPIIRIEKIERTEKPSEEFVYPPDDSFIATSTIL